MLKFPPELDFDLFDLIKFRIEGNITRAEISRAFESNLTSYFPKPLRNPYEKQYFLISFNTQTNKFIIVTFEYITDKIAILDAYRPTKEEIA
jgi:hypothetical protein